MIFLLIDYTFWQYISMPASLIKQCNWGQKLQLGTGLYGQRYFK